MGEEIFDRVADEYSRLSLPQRAAADRLLGLAAIGPGESVLDVGCGPGHITARIAELTRGRVVGADISPAMVEQARSCYPGITFEVVAAEDLDIGGEFDVVFCNSTLQWFRDPPLAVAAMARCARKGGRLALACPGSDRFSPFFEKLMTAVVRDPEVGPVFKRWRNPWFFLSSVGEYRDLFEARGLETRHIEIYHEVHEYTTDEAYGVYSSGAGQGYRNPDFYDVDLPEGFFERFDEAVRREIEEMERSGPVEVDFNRLYYIGWRV